MKTKLTLTLEKDIIVHAKEYAKATGISLSELIQDYLRKISTGLNPEQENFDEPTSRFTKYSGIIELDWDPVQDRDKFRDLRNEKYSK